VIIRAWDIFRRMVYPITRDTEIANPFQMGKIGQLYIEFVNDCKMGVMFIEAADFTITAMDVDHKIMSYGLGEYQTRVFGGLFSYSSSIF
jgi:hypothetical protein